MNMEYGIYPSEGLEIRRRGGGGRSISGRFGLSPGKFRRMGTVRNRGKVRKEMLMKKSFAWSLNQVKKLKDDVQKLIQQKAKKEVIEDATQELARRDIHILAGHDFSRVLGSVAAGSAVIEEVEDELDPHLRFEVELPEDESKWPSYMRDTVNQIETGLVSGVSPGFVVPPKSAVPDAEELLPEPGNESVYVRKINQATLYELSIVTRPVFTESEVSVRAEDAEQDFMRNGFRIWL